MEFAANVNYRMLCKIVNFQSYRAYVVWSELSELMLEAYKQRAVTGRWKQLMIITRLVKPKYASTTEEGEIPSTYIFWMREDYRPSRTRIFLSRSSSSWAVEQFYSDASLETVDRQVMNNSKNWQWTTEGNISTWRSTPAPHGDEWPCSFFQAVGSKFVYCYRCINVGFINSSTSAAPWTACKDAFIMEPLHSKPSTAVSAMSSWAQNLASWLSSSSLFRWIKPQFVEPRWPRSS